jgi:hypothetical protein
MELEVIKLNKSGTAGQKPRFLTHMWMLKKLILKKKKVGNDY